MKKLFRFFLILFAAAILVGGYARFIEPNLLRVSRQKVSTAGKTEPLTAVFFTDTHFGSQYSPRNLAKIAEKINAQNPDLVFFGGDFFDAYWQDADLLDLDMIAEELSKIQAPLGKYAVWGNHDRGGGASRVYENVLSKGGFTVLSNQWLSVPDSNLTIAGVDDALLGSPSLNLEGASPEAFTILLSHEPDLIAAKALLLGLSMEDVHNILVVTGDPVPSASRDEVKAVFSFNSAMLAGYIRALGEETLQGPFLVAGALNVNAPNFDAELKKAHRKKESGVQMLMTQPVFTEEALQNLRRAKEETGLWILGGLMPPVSYRNACYMHNEISGIRLSEEILERYKDTDREEAGKIGVSLCLEMAGKMTPWVDGYYLMTPFQRIDLIEEIVRRLGR